MRPPGTVASLAEQRQKRPRCAPITPLVAPLVPLSPVSKGGTDSMKIDRGEFLEELGWEQSWHRSPVCLQRAHTRARGEQR